MSPTLNRLNKEFWLWCMERDITVHAQHLAGALNCTADAESRVMRDRSDWMLCPNVFQAINDKVGPLEVDLCLQTDNPTFIFRELEAGPGGNSHRCLHSDLDRSKGVCQPTVEPGGKGSLPGSATGSRSDPGGTSVENSAVVPDCTGNVQRLSTTNPSGKESNPTNPSTSDAGCGPPTSRVEYLRGRYKEQQLSEKATELMLASWREKSSKAYGSQF